LAANWEQNPPFPNDWAYAGAIRSYRQAILDGSRKVALEQGMEAGFASWFRSHADFLAAHGGVTDARGAVPTMLSLYESDPTCLSDLGALNRWAGRSSLPLPDYLRAWQASCVALRTPARLPTRLEQMFAGG
jgi:hypothetical protein